MEEMKAYRRTHRQPWAVRPQAEPPGLASQPGMPRMVTRASGLWTREEKTMFSPDEWLVKSYEERLDALQNVEFEEARRQGRPSNVVFGDKLPPYENGSYRPSGNAFGGAICVNEELIKNDRPHETLKCLFHESRHAYQHHEAALPEASGDPERALLFRHNIDNYISPQEDYEGYRDQPIEVDARSYAENQMTLYANGQAKRQGLANGTPDGREATKTPYLASQTFRAEEERSSPAEGSHKSPAGVAKPTEDDKLTHNPTEAANQRQPKRGLGNPH